MPPSPSRQRAERTGRQAEFLAALYLRLKLYAVAERRYRTPVGEIDLIVRRGDVIAFVEVKARSGRLYELGAHEAVNRQRLTRAARYYLGRNPALAGRTLRFDVIFLAPFAWPRHVVNAFDAF